MSDKLKKIIQTPEVPEELRPENIPSLIQRNNIKQKSNIKIIRYVSALTACAVIALCTVHFLPQKNEDLYQTEPSSNSDKLITDETDDINVIENLYFNNIENYDDIYTHLKKNEIKEERKSFFDKIFGFSTKNLQNESIILEDAPADDGYAEEDAITNDADFDGAVQEETAGEYGDASGAGTGEVEVSDTLQQVKGIAEADIIKANENCIFFINNDYYEDCLISIPFDNKTGTFGEKNVITFTDEYDNCEIYVNEMYLSDDKLILIADVHDKTYYEYSYNVEISTAVITYDVSDNTPELLDRYYQSGEYSDSRMIDNILYLTTNQYEYYYSIEDPQTYEEYIPTCGNSYEDMECIEANDIYIPKDWDNDLTNISYVNIAGIDINSPSEPVSIVSVAGHNGNLYCSDSNIYITQNDYSNRTNQTSITRFSTDNGVITPETSGSVDGYVLNQFSMDEYKGYFRIATTSQNNITYYEGYAEYSISNSDTNNVFVLDMDMNVVGSITDIARTESIKSVTFKGDTGYVVTYEQTDPLFAIDFSVPYNPVITDEFKITGYSSFLYKWSDDLLLGFGVDADEYGIERGVKLVMFDVSDNGDLKECGMYRISSEELGIYSLAVYDRKALLLDSERNLIGFPVEAYNNGTIFTYNIFSYENGKFVPQSVIYSEHTLNGDGSFLRAVYIGDYLCAFTYTEAVCMNLNDMSETDRIVLY